MINQRDIKVVIRSASERTEAICSDLLQKECGFEDIYVLHEAPFSKAIQKGFEIGLESGKPWLLCIDADVLVRKDGIMELLAIAETLPDHLFEVQGLIRDKFLPVNRPAGNHLYRLKYANEAISCIPKEGTSLRPEGTMLKVMAAKGHPWYQSDALVGIHDFEQFYKDIYRKCFLHARKHDYLIPKVLPYWLEQSKKDKDFEVALLACGHSLISNEDILISKDFGLKEAVRSLEVINLTEKTHGFIEIDQVMLEIKEILAQKSLILQEEVFPYHLTNRLSSIVDVQDDRLFKAGMRKFLLKVSDKLKLIANNI